VTRAEEAERSRVTNCSGHSDSREEEEAEAAVNVVQKVEILAIDAG
jgi:hypothetical protein